MKANARILFWTALATVAVVAGSCGSSDGAGPRGVGPGQVGAGQGDDALPSDVEDMVEDMVDEIMAGGDPEDAIEDAKASAEAMVDAFGGDGSGRVEIYDQSIEFTSEVCIFSQGDFVIEGLGQASDGTPVWVSIDHTVDTREELLEFMAAEMVDRLYGDTEIIRSSSVTIDFGRSELFAGAADDQPSFSAEANHLSGDDGLTVEVSGSGISGSGEASDHNFIVGEWDDRFPFTFQAACG